MKLFSFNLSAGGQIHENAILTFNNVKFLITYFNVAMMHIEAFNLAGTHPFHGNYILLSSGIRREVMMFGIHYKATCTLCYSA